MIKKRGFTLIEIIVASGILSLFMIGVFQLHRSGSQSFALGFWKSRAQKDAQSFLEEFRTVVEMSGNAIVFQDTAIDSSLLLPLQIDANCQNTELSLSSLTNDTMIAFMNTVSPCTLHSNLAKIKETGKWFGTVMSANKGTLELRYYSDPSLLPTQAMPWALALGGDFVATTSPLRRAKKIKDVEKIEMRSNTVSGNVQLTIIITLLRPNGKTRVKQDITMNLLKGVSISWF